MLNLSCGAKSGYTRMASGKNTEERKNFRKEFDLPHSSVLLLSANIPV